MNPDFFFMQMIVVIQTNKQTVMLAFFIAYFDFLTKILEKQLDF